MSADPPVVDLGRIPIVVHDDKTAREAAKYVDALVRQRLDLRPGDKIIINTVKLA